MNRRNNKPELIIREREDPFKYQILERLESLDFSIKELTKVVKSLKFNMKKSSKFKRKDAIFQIATSSQTDLDKLNQAK